MSVGSLTAASATVAILTPALAEVVNDWVTHIVLSVSQRPGGYPFDSGTLAPLMGTPDLLAHVLCDPRVYFCASGKSKSAKPFFKVRSDPSRSDEEWASANARLWTLRILAAPAHTGISVDTILSMLTSSGLSRGAAIARLDALLNVLRLDPSLSFGIDSRMWLMVRRATASDPLAAKTATMAFPAAPLPVRHRLPHSLPP